VLSTAMLFGLLVAALSVTTYRVLVRQLDRDVTTRLLETANAFQGYLRFSGDQVSLGYDQGDDDEAAFVQEATRYYQVYDAESGRLLTESPGMTPLGLELTSAEVQAARGAGRPVDVNTEYGRLRMVTRDVDHDGRKYLLNMGTPLATLDALGASYRTILIWRVPAGFLVALAAAWWLSVFALRPLTAMAAATNDIDVARLDRRLPVRGARDELDEVATAFNRTLERLESSVGEMRQFSAALAHELRTPLAALRGGIELELRAPGASEPQRQAFASQLDEIDRLTRLIDHILTLARAESGQFHLTFEPVDLGALAASLVEQLEPVAESRALALTCTQENHVVVRGDAGWLQRLLLNLMDNAVKFTPPNGAVEVRVSSDADSAHIAVQDTGIGLTPQDARQVFERFFRADPARTTSVEGAGLGLSLVQWIAEQHHGTVTVDSAHGRGSTFTVTIPLNHA
jgi:heavy metal sensor kinase